jgi:hypothetical protein
MSETHPRLSANITYWLNVVMALLALSSYLIGGLTQSNVVFPSIISTVAHTGLVIYWRFWYVFALPAFYLGQNTQAPRRRMLLTAMTVVVILLLKFLLGYQIPG